MSHPAKLMSLPAKTILLLNASNMEGFPVFPYAFVQVAAVARRAGIAVVSRDLLGIPPSSWEDTLQDLIIRHNPAMILVTLRNTDTLTATDYESGESSEENLQPYFPIERTKALIAAIRQVSNLKIVLGGFAFSILPAELMHYLEPDFGVFGGPDDFFTHFADIEAGKLERVRNLLYFRDGQLVSNPRFFFPPFTGREYTPEIIGEMLAFYASFPEPGFQGAPLEIIRGCNHSCVFCSEPLVKGNQVQYRHLSAVMADIQLLAENGLTRLYMITSELNPEGNEFILQLADRISTFNSGRDDDQQITWFGANYLLGFSAGEYARLYESGFTGGWWDITALDDENARQMRTPYRVRSLVHDLKVHAAARRVHNSAQDGGDEGVSWTMFLGNPATTKETIRKTLEITHRDGIAAVFESCRLFTHIRVFDYEEPAKDVLGVTYSVSSDLRRADYQQLLPSFAYPPALLEDFSEAEITELFKYLGSTFLSSGYTRTRDWSAFLRRSTDSTNLSRWLAELGAVDAHLHLDEDQAWEVVNLLLSFSLEHNPNFFQSLDLPHSIEGLARTSPYELARSVYSRGDTEKGFIDQVNLNSRPFAPAWLRGLLQFSVLALLYKFNIRIKPNYRDFFV